MQTQTSLVNLVAMTTKQVSVKTTVSILATGFVVCLAVDHILHPKPLRLTYVVNVLLTTVGLTLVALLYVFESDDAFGIHYYMDQDYNILSEIPDSPQPQPPSRPPSLLWTPHSLRQSYRCW